MCAVIIAAKVTDAEKAGAPIDPTIGMGMIAIV
jgi:hypothetical protein